MNRWETEQTFSSVSAHGVWNAFAPATLEVAKKASEEFSVPLSIYPRTNTARFIACDTGALYRKSWNSMHLFGRKKYSPYAMTKNDRSPFVG